ncbi:integrase catalytic domain-containing protein [Trichonephila clavipes]|nr:integrase catalytic domain-containing protein [Trichonephila clavipes]
MLKKSNVLQGPLKREELSEADRFSIQVEQEKFFPEELKSLKDNTINREKTPLYNCVSYLDENGLIRLGGRLEFCNLSINERPPLILPKNSWLTTLIVRREHNKKCMEEQPVHKHNFDQITGSPKDISIS